MNEFTDIEEGGQEVELYVVYFKHIHFKTRLTCFAFLHIIEKEDRFRVDNWVQIYLWIYKKNSGHTPGAHQAIFWGKLYLYLAIIEEVVSTILIRE